ncbi:MAG: hypothetical protein GYB33_16540 [Gammaproteobacteria bacterium]|nr:hypothetical protein [Gammaproteobacteria bacterium]
MIRTWLTCILVALIALQSALASADIHEPHQTGTEHQVFTHDHAAQAESNNSNNSNNSATIDPHSTAAGSAFDCHHCCHCHGVAQLYLNPKHHWLDLATTFSKVQERRLSFISYQFPPDIRPPIA